MQGGAQPVGLSCQAGEVLQAAERQAQSMKDDYVSTEHLLMALASGDERKRLADFGVTPEATLNALASIRGSQRVVSPESGCTYQALEKYGRDLTSWRAAASWIR